MSNYNCYNNRFAKNSQKWTASMEQIGVAMQKGAHSMAKKRMHNEVQIENVHSIKQKEMVQRKIKYPLNGVQNITKVDGNTSVSKYADGTFLIKIQKTDESCYQMANTYEGIKHDEKIHFVPDIGVRIYNCKLMGISDIKEITISDTSITIIHRGHKFIMEDGKDLVVVNNNTGNSVNYTTMTIKQWFDNDLAIQ